MLTQFLRAILWSLHNGDFPECGPPPEGRVSINKIDGVVDDYWLVAGYRRIGPKIMRVDMVERVSALVRAEARNGPFKMTDDMLSLAGVSRDEMKEMILDLGCKILSEEASDDPEKPSVPIFERQRRQRQPRDGQNQRQKPKKSGKSSARHNQSGKSTANQQAGRTRKQRKLKSLILIHLCGLGSSKEVKR